METFNSTDVAIFMIYIDSIIIIMTIFLIVFLICCENFRG
jgi:hypothetical protein